MKYTYVFSIAKIVKFARINKHKVMTLPANERLNAMKDLIDKAELSYEFEDRSCDELEDTHYELEEILETDYLKVLVLLNIKLPENIVDKNVKVNENVDELIQMFNCNYDEIVNYLSNKYYCPFL